MTTENSVKKNGCSSQVGNIYECEVTGDRTFRCDQCGKCFKQKANLRQHKRTHTGEKPFKCNYCNKCFGHKGHLNEHKRIHTGERPFQCNQCNKRFTRGGILQQHKRTHSGEKPFKCNVCDKRFNQKGLLNQHMKTYSGMCFLKGLKVDERTHGKTGEKHFECSHCGKNFSNKGNLKQHKRTCTGQKQFKCNYCYKCFGQKGLLSQHQEKYHLLSFLGNVLTTTNIHAEEECLTENEYNKYNHQGENLQQNKTTDVQDKSLNCNYGENFEIQKVILDTQLERTDLAGESCHENNFVLPTCSTFQIPLTSGNLSSGDLSESKGRSVNALKRDEDCPLKCNWCEKCFRQKEHLEVHKLTHTGQKPFECNQCGQRFSLKRNLNQHRKTHLEENGFKCNYCNKNFGHKGHLNEHKRIHTGEKPFKCNQCGKCFNRNSLLKKHQETHTIENFYKLIQSDQLSSDLGIHAGEGCLNHYQQCFPQLQQHKSTDGESHALNSDENEKSEKETDFSNLTGEPWRKGIVVLPGTVQSLKISESSTSDDTHRAQAENIDKSERQGGQPLKCNQCNKCFEKKEDLERNKRMHTEQKPFKCNQCGKGFSLKGNLNQHKRTHSGEKAFKCNYCYKCFSHKGHLNEHKRIHTGEKPFKCNECDKRFNRKGLLKQHQQLTHQLLKDVSIQIGEDPFNENKYFHQTDNLQQNKIRGEQDQSSNCSKAGNFETHQVILEKETHKRNLPGEPWHEGGIVLPGIVQTISVSEHSIKNNNMCKTQAGDINEHERREEHPLKCNQCNKCFRKGEDLEWHKRLHLGQKPFECNQCGKRFSLKGNLNQHKRTHSREKAFKCNYCYKCFSHKGHLNEHKRIHTGEKPFKCNECDKRFNRKGLLKQHQQLTHQLLKELNIQTAEEPLNENQYDKYFHQAENLQQKETTDEQDKPLNYDDGDKFGAQGEFLEKETERTNLTGDPQCEAVVVLPATVQTLIISQNSTTGDICNGEAGNVDKHESQEEQRLECYQYKSCYGKRDLEQRKRTHAGEQAFQCNYCSKRFATKWRLVGHERIHTGEKPFICNQCGKRFGNKGNLNQHTRTHTGEKPFKCPYCHKCFSHKGHLNEHARIHTGEKPFKCDQCNRGFTRPGVLRQHKRTHTGELPFKCNQCEKRFNQKGLLNQHLKKHTGEKRLKCDKCDQLLSDQDKRMKTLTGINSGENPLNRYLCDKCSHETSNLRQLKTADSGATPLNCDQGEMFETQEVSLEMKTETDSLAIECDNYLSISELVINIKEEIRD